MKYKYIFFISLIIAGLCFSGCERAEQDVTATLTDHSDCKGLKSMNDDDVPGNQSCISYSYDSSSGVLSVTHFNAGFNCCPGKLSCNASVVSDTLVITEKEKAPLCDCDCLYDLYIEVSNIEEQCYIISIDEPYCGDQAKLIFEIDLINKPSGSYCVTRDQYPWGIYE